MRYLILIMAFILTLSAFDWPDDYDASLSQSKEQKKDIYLLIGSEYCPWCEKFKKNVLSDKEVIDKLKKNYVLLYLSVDIDDIPSHLKKGPLPRHYFLTNNGEIIYTTMGYRSKDGFYEVLDEVKELK